MHPELSENISKQVDLIEIIRRELVLLANMSNETGNPKKGRNSHAPLVPQQEIQSNFQALTLFVPMVIKYIARHLIIGSYIRLRRIALRRLGRVYYL